MMTKNTSPFLMIIKHDFLLLARNPISFCIPLLFFILVTLLFPLSISPEKKLLQTLCPGVIWIAILLAHLLTLSQLFSQDHEDGTLDQWMMHQNQLITFIVSRLSTYWFFYIFPLILLVPFLSILYSLPFFTLKMVMLSLLLGTPIIVMQGAIAASLCVGLNRSGLLLAIILLPMYIPTMILGVTIIAAAQAGMSVLFQFDMLIGILILAMAFGPAVVAFALRIGITYS